MTDPEVMSALRTAWEYTYLHDDWVTPLDEVLEGVDAEKAITPGPEGTPSIWMIVLHMAKWNENIVERIEGIQISPLDEDAHWPDPPDSPDAAAWEKAKERLHNSIALVEETLETATLEKVQSSQYGLPDLLCRFTHMGYHIGQMTKMGR